jgi:Zn-dependent protease with chaperone function
MNFFEHQDKARKKTFWLILYFILAIIMIILAIDCVVIGAFAYTNPEVYYPLTEYGHVLNKGALIQLAILTTITVSPTIIFVIFFGTIIKLISLREGGIAVAKMVNAREIDPSTTDLLEKRFINVVEEMAIASGVSIPKLYVMDDEPAINAFVAGMKPQDTVMVITKGALTQLSRDELQGVVGHEFSHVFNSDMNISLRLMGILGGLLVIGQAGYFLLRILGTGNRRSRDSEGRLVIAMVIVGIGLLVIGYIGLFFGRLIKAAVSRERELLADASSVQYTRNPQGIIFALKRIQQSEKGSRLESKNVEDISHLCFSTPRWIMFSNLLATHPPIDQRIKTLDPEGAFGDIPLESWSVKQKPPPQETKEKKSPLEPLGMIGAAAVLATGGSEAQITTVDIKKSIGNPSQEHIEMAQNLLAQIPENLQQAAHTPEQVALIFYALILRSDEEKIAEITKILEKAINAQELQNVLAFNKQILNLPHTIVLPLIDISLPAFKANSPDNRRAIFDNMQKLVALDKENLFRFTLMTIIGKAVENQLPKDTKVKYQDYNEVKEEISALLTIIIKNSTKDEQQKTNLYNQLMKNLIGQDNFPPQANISAPIKFHAILTKLNLLSPLCKEKLIHTILDCIAEDNIINVTEAELVRVIATSLDCPIPPIMATI